MLGRLLKVAAETCAWCLPHLNFPHLASHTLGLLSPQAAALLSSASRLSPLPSPRLLLITVAVFVFPSEEC